MKQSSYKLFVLFLTIGLLQSCYTLIYPPQSQPQTVTTVVSEPAMASTVGAVGGYGWDPYWEPALPFTSYHQGYGASYYDPYNYYDYHHPRYAPVYVVSETTDPSPAREFRRDESQGGSRTRALNGTANTSGSGTSKAGSLVGIGSGLSTSSPAIIAPITKNPVVTTPVKRKPEKRMLTSPPKKNIKQAKVSPPKPVKKSKEADKPKSPPPEKKRTRTRK